MANVVQQSHTAAEEALLRLFADAPLFRISREDLAGKAKPATIQRLLAKKDIVWVKDGQSYYYRINARRVALVKLTKAKDGKAARREDEQYDVTLVGVEGDENRGWAKTHTAAGDAAVRSTARIRANGRAYRKLVFPISKNAEVASELRGLGAVVNNRVSTFARTHKQFVALLLPYED